MATNARLTFEQMKELLSLFIANKMTSLKLGDFELSKEHYAPEIKDSDKPVFQEDPLFYSSPNVPTEIQMLLESMKPKG
jgi:hypothetical protein